MDKIRIFLADYHEIPRVALAALLDSQPEMEVVGQSGDSRDTLEQLGRLTPDVLILDLTLPGTGGMKVIEKVRKEHPATQVLVLTSHDDPAYFHAAQALGCAGYVSKADAIDELLGGIRAVRDGRSYTGKRVAVQDNQPPPNGQPAPSRAPCEALTARERQVLQLLAQGYSYQRIAEGLFLSVKTIETYRTRIGQKLGFHSRADLIRYALETGLIGPSKAAGPPAMNGSHPTRPSETPCRPFPQDDG